MTEIKTEVAIIGGGTSGMAAAVSAAEYGAKVAVLEKGATTGGTGNMGMGMFAVESRIQKENDIKFSRGDAFRVLMTYNHWKADARLAKKYIDKSADTLDWLEKMGVKFAGLEKVDEGAYPTCHGIANPEGKVVPQSSATMIKCLTERAKNLGVNIQLKTTAQKILKGQGGITGVLASNFNDEELRVNCRAVIIGTGGFGDNPELVKKYTGFNWGQDMLSFRIPGCVGEGMRMALEAGAGASPTIMHMIYVGADTLGETKQEAELTIASRQPNLVVNLQGERIFNEEMMENNTFTGNAISLQKDRTVFNIIDENTLQYYENKGLDTFYPVLVLPTIPGLGAAIKRVADTGKKIVFVADSLEELAAKTGINLKSLLKTVIEYNQACEQRYDAVFEKSPKYLLRSITKPRFYAFRLLPGGYGTLGGIKVNHNLEALTKNYDVIPGLYAVGSDANNLYGESYCFILPGQSMGFAVNSGRMAGENAAEYCKSIDK